MTYKPRFGAKKVLVVEPLSCDTVFLFLRLNTPAILLHIHYTEMYGNICSKKKEN